MRSWNRFKSAGSIAATCHPGQDIPESLGTGRRGGHRSCLRWRWCNVARGLRQQLSRPGQRVAVRRHAGVAANARRHHAVQRVAKRTGRSPRYFLGCCGASTATAHAIKRYLSGHRLTLLDWQTDFPRGRTSSSRSAAPATVAGPASSFSRVTTSWPPQAKGTKPCRVTTSSARPATSSAPRATTECSWCAKKAPRRLPMFAHQRRRRAVAISAARAH